jgi:hypothetical protein
LEKLIDMTIFLPIFLTPILALAADRPGKRTNIDSFVGSIKSFLASPAALRSLRHTDIRGKRTSSNAWLHGGCFVLAEALGRFLGEKASVFDIVINNVPHHAVVKIGDIFVDGRGPFYAVSPGGSADEMQALFPGATGVVPHEPLGWPLADPEDVNALVSALVRRFGVIDVLRGYGG